MCQFVRATKQALRIGQTQVNKRVISALRWSQDAANQSGLRLIPGSCTVLPKTPGAALCDIGSDKDFSVLCWKATTCSSASSA
jgi:hypothetical protein